MKLIPIENFFFFLLKKKFSLFSSVSLAVGSMYVKKYFKEDSKKAALEMVRDIREEFNNILTNLNWMDSETK